MNQPALDLFAMFVLSLVGTIVFAMRAYVAWFSPEEHAEFLITQKSLFRKPASNETVASPSLFTVWFTRLSYSIGFVLTSGMLIWVVITMIVGQ